MGNTLAGKRIACVATNGFEYVELIEPKRALEAEGAVVDIISPEKGSIKGMDHLDWHNEPVAVTKTVKEAEPSEYDALLLPGGVANPDTLRLSNETIAFIQDFVVKEKPIAAICHGPWTLINAEGVSGKKLTSWPTLQADLQNAGAQWIDQDVVVDGTLVTSRKPDDIPAFNKQMIDLFGK